LLEKLWLIQEKFHILFQAIGKLKDMEPSQKLFLRTPFHGCGSAVSAGTNCGGIGVSTPTFNAEMPSFHSPVVLKF
jgi:hypothetical protein